MTSNLSTLKKQPKLTAPIEKPKRRTNFPPISQFSVRFLFSLAYKSRRDYALLLAFYAWFLPFDAWRMVYDATPVMQLMLAHFLMKNFDLACPRRAQHIGAVLCSYLGRAPQRMLTRDLFKKWLVAVVPVPLFRAAAPDGLSPSSSSARRGWRWESVWGCSAGIRMWMFGTGMAQCTTPVLNITNYRRTDQKPTRLHKQHNCTSSSWKMVHCLLPEIHFAIFCGRGDQFYLVGAAKLDPI